MTDAFLVASLIGDMYVVAPDVPTQNDKNSVGKLSTMF